MSTKGDPDGTATVVPSDRIATVVAIGDELLSGETVDTNSSYLDAQLESWGWRVVRHLTVADDEADIAAAFKEAASRSALVLSTGGMGPTQDDLTMGGLAAALGCPLVLNEVALEALKARFAARGWSMSPNNRRQAMVPEWAEVLVNEVGSAPCITATLFDAQVYCMPGVPSEVRWLLEHRVKPRVGPSAPLILRRAVKVIGVGESRLENELRAVIDAHSGVQFGFRTMGAENHVKLAAGGSDASGRLTEAESAVRAALGDRVFGNDGESLSEVVGAELKAAGQTVATAESCTGGLIAKRLTDVPGSSAYVTGGVVAYANQAKVSLLGVDPDVIEAHGAVSEPVARQMAAGVRERLGADWGLSATGVAGPGGGTPEKPVGLVWIGLAGPEGVQTRSLDRPGNRANIRDGTAKILMHWLLNEVRGSTS